MSDTTTKPEAWPVREHIRRPHTWTPSLHFVVTVQAKGAQDVEMYFHSREEAEAFARTPIDRWERDRAVELLSEVRHQRSDFRGSYERIQEFLEPIEGGDRG